MGEAYKKQITEQIKDAVNDWIEKLKIEYSELLITMQWSVIWPKGFAPGHNVIPVVTGSKKGKHLIGSVQFLLPENLELDMDTVELVLKNEPFKEVKGKKGKNVPVPLDEPLDILNELILGLNEFISGINIPTLTQTNRPQFSLLASNPKKSARKVNVINGNRSTITATDLDDVMSELIKSQALPDWFRSVESLDVRSELIKKIAEALLHYRKQTGRQVDIREFFDQYNQHLLKQNKLHHWCKYKSKPVRLDSSQHCTESYCSKKPYHSECPQAVLKFGTVNNGDY